MADCLTTEDFERYTAGALTEAERNRFDAHLARCDRCRTSFEQHRGDEAFAGYVRGALGDDVSLPDDSGIDQTVDLDHTPAASEADPRYPRIAGYRITGVAGSGGMGVVYEATQTTLDREVALKVLPALLGTASPQAVARFRREAVAAAKLHHTNIIPIYDSGQSPDGYYYAMELIDGTPLDRVIRRLASEHLAATTPTRLAELLQTRGTSGRVATAGDHGSMPGATVSADRAGHSAAPPDHPPTDGAASSETGTDPSGGSAGHGRIFFRQIAHWMASVADALDCAHKQGIIHRDIKPSNLILSRDGRLMVGDFGLARSAEDQSVTMTGSLVGTLRYMSPEQAMAKRVRVDHRTDIYSLGATLYELLTFHPAFPGSEEKEILGAIISREPTAPRKLHPAVPRELETICLKMLEKDPAARYATARALADDLGRYIEDLPIEAKRPSLVDRVVKFTKRHKGPVVAACSGVLLIVAVVLLIRSIRQEARAQLQKQINQARLLEGEGQWAAAEAVLQEALGPRSADTLGLYELARIKKEHFNNSPEPRDPKLLQESEQICRRVLDSDPEHFKTLNLHAVILKKLGRYDEALATCRKVTDLQPDYYPAWVNLGTWHALRGNLTQAEQCLRTSVDHARGDESWAVDTWRNLASLQFYLGKTGAAANIVLAIECNRKDRGSFLIQARMLLDGDPDAALQSASTADYLAEGRDARVKRLVAWGNLEVGQFAKALDHARRAIELGDPPALNHLIIAVAQARLGRIEAAHSALAQADATWPDRLRTEPYLASAYAGVLWFDTAEELDRLRTEADAALLQPSSSP